MIVFLIFLFYLSAFIIFWAMIGYQNSLKMIGNLYRSRKLLKDYNYIPSVTILVVAHNEEKVILEKLQNIILLDYPNEKIEFLISSDNSTDNTNKIINKFIIEHPHIKMRLYEVNERKGKTNAQNEAQKIVMTEYMVMTDANSIMDTKSVRELMAAFTSEEIAYVSGRLILINENASDVSNAEVKYWSNDLKIREIEGRIKTITAGNGAIYACRTRDYIEFNPIQCHDSSMPLQYALAGKRAIANHDAIAFEKAGELIGDEFGRKVRMNRIILKHILPDIRLLNIFKYGWFSYFYFGHRSCRYLLWISHLILFITSLFLIHYSLFYFIVFSGQLIFYLAALFKSVTKSSNKYLTSIYYYTVTIIAQWVGVYKILSGEAKPFWEKAGSTR